MACGGSTYGVKTFPARIHRLYPSVPVCHQTPSQRTGQLLPGCCRCFSSDVAALAWLTHDCNTLCKGLQKPPQCGKTLDSHWGGIDEFWCFPAPSRAPCRNCATTNWATTFSPGRKDLFMDNVFSWGQQMRQFLTTLVIRQHSACAGGIASAHFAVIMVVLQRSPRYSWGVDACGAIIFSCTSTG